MFKILWFFLKNLPTIIPIAFITFFLIKLLNWIYLTFFWSSKSSVLGVYGSGNRRSWALVTGASDGIGAGFARELAKQKFNLFLVGRNPEKLEKIKSELLNEGIKVVCLISEASDASYENIQKLFHQINEILLPLKDNTIRILINNVGIGLNGKRRLEDIKAAGIGLFEEIVGVNCIYPVILTREFLKRLNCNLCDRIAIINIASCAALTPATPFSSLYAATKAFNRSFSISLSGEMTAKRLLHPEINLPPVDVVCVNPGFVVSNMTKMNESIYCCNSQDHAQVVFSKITRTWPFGSGFAVDIVPHWKHGIMWAALASLEILIPYEWLLVAIIMPISLNFFIKFGVFAIKE